MFVYFIPEKESREKKEVEEQLANTGQLITALQKTQYERLSQKVPSHLAHVPGPTDKEKQLGKKTCSINLGLKILFVSRNGPGKNRVDK